MTVGMISGIARVIPSIRSSRTARSVNLIFATCTYKRGINADCKASFETGWQPNSTSVIVAEDNGCTIRNS